MELDKLGIDMDASAHQIHTALQAVADLRRERAADPRLARASAEVKRFQARRFRATYADLLEAPRYKTAAQFFLDELYSERDYARRDEEFGRIAGTIARIFPQAVVNTAASLADVHALTERLDDQMARHWQLQRTENESAEGESTESECARYVRSWRAVADAAARHHQLEVVIQLGQSLNRLTRMPGLRMMLKMMRRPAAASGLESLQKFLESGFDAFADMRGADEFLRVIRSRETAWIESLFEGDAVACETQLAALMKAARAD
jgi:hypothetical protein